MGWGREKGGGRAYGYVVGDLEDQLPLARFPLHAIARLRRVLLSTILTLIRVARYDVRSSETCRIAPRPPLGSPARTRCRPWISIGGKRKSDLWPPRSRELRERVQVQDALWHGWMLGAMLGDSESEIVTWALCDDQTRAPQRFRPHRIPPTLPSPSHPFPFLAFLFLSTTIARQQPLFASCTLHYYVLSSSS